MGKTRDFKRLAAAGLGAVALVATGSALGAGWAVSASPDEAEEIHACVNDRSGALRIVAVDEECRAGERPLTWNQEGPAGLLDIQVVQGNSTVDSDDNTDRVSATVECPAGYRVVGGGAGLSFGVGNTTWFTVSSAPVEAGAGVFEEDGWTATFQTSDGEDAEGQYGFRARAICALTP